MLAHFLICLKHIWPERHLAVGIKYSEQIELLIEEFNDRFTLSSEEKLHLKIIKNPFSIDPEETPSYLQMNLSNCRLHLYTKVNTEKAEC